jgi:glycosyltransferase involved in cell wall biosynthesis
MQIPAISLLIANYNNSRYIGQTIESVLQQSFSDWEIVVLDDGSSDDIDSVMQTYLSDTRIRFLQNPSNRGCAFTKNRLLNEAGGWLAAFLDADDQLLPGALQTMVDLHQQHPSCSLIHSTHYLCNADLEIIKLAPYVRALPPNTPYLLLGDASIHHFATWKMQAYRATVGTTAERWNDISMDQDLYYLLEEVGEVLFHNEPLYLYRIHSGSISNWGNERAGMEAHYEVIERACLRRINQCKLKGDTVFLKKYRTRYHKIKMLNDFRKRKWVSFTGSLFAYPFVGGFSHLYQYVLKLPQGGLRMISNSLLGNYQALKDSK